MDVSELIVNLYEGTYEQDDRVPYDATGVISFALPGTIALVGALNRAIRIVATWKFPNGERVRLRSTRGSKYITTPETGYNFLNLDPTGALSLAAGWVLPTGQPVNTNTLILPAITQFIGKPDDYFAGSVIAFQDGTKFLILGSVGLVITIQSVSSIDWSDSPFMIHPTSLEISGQATSDVYLPQYVTVADIFSIDSGSSITRANAGEKFDNAYQAIGTPTSYYASGSKLYFDAAIQKPFTMNIRYWKFPKPITALNSVIDLPDSFHEVVLLLAKSDELRRVGEVTEADSSFRKASNLMQILRTEIDFDQEATDTRLYPEA